MGRTLLAAIITIMILQTSCKKENGIFYLRINAPADTSIKDLEVFDATGPVAVDGEFHQVTQYLEIKYKVSHAISSQIKDWDNTSPYDEFSYSDLTFHEYLGEFEKDEKDKYYSLEVNYRSWRDEDPIYNQWAEYYFYDYDYQDSSRLTISYIPE